MKIPYVVVGMTLCACMTGIDNQVRAAGPGGDSCAYVAEADITEIMSHPMKYGEDAENGECTLVSAQDDPMLAASVGVFPTLSFYELMSNAEGNEVLTGIGDHAVLVASGVSAMVVARKGSSSYIGSVYNGNDGTAARPQAIAIARSVLDRM